MALSTDTVSKLHAASEYLRMRGRHDLADAVDSAILLNADQPNALANARAAGYQAAISHDCDSEEWGA